MNPDINNRKKAEKFTNMWMLNNTFLSNHWVRKQIKKKIKSEEDRYHRISVTCGIQKHHIIEPESQMVGHQRLGGGEMRRYWSKDAKFQL